MKNTKILNIRDALKLYALLKDAIPENIDGNTTHFDFASIIMKKMDVPENYGLSVMLMHGLSVDDLSKMKIQEIIRLFIGGLEKNNIWDLVTFCRSMEL